MVKLRYAQRHSTCSCRKVQIKLVPVNKSHVIWSVSSSCLLTRNIYRKYCHNERRSVLKRDVDCKCVSLKDKMQARACTLEHLDQRSLKGFSCLLHDNLVLLPFSKMNLEFSKNWVYHQMPFSHTVGTWRGGLWVGHEALHMQFRVKRIGCAYKSKCAPHLKLRNHDQNTNMFLIISCFALVASALGEWFLISWQRNLLPHSEICGGSCGFYSCCLTSCTKGK